MGKRRKSHFSSTNSRRDIRRDDEAASRSCKAGGCSKLRRNSRGEYCCSICGKVQPSRSSSTRRSAADALQRKRRSSKDVADEKAKQSRQDRSGTPNKKLPGLLDLSPSLYHPAQSSSSSSNPVSLISLPSPTPLFDLMAQHRRPHQHYFAASPAVMVARQPLFSSTDCSSSCCIPSSYTTTTTSSNSSRADYVRGADLKLPAPAADPAAASTGAGGGGERWGMGGSRPKSSSSSGPSSTTRSARSRRAARSKRAHKATMTTMTTEPSDHHNQGEGEGAEKEKQGLDYISYVRGFYCRLCRTLLGEDPEHGISHSREPSHLAKVMESDKEDELLKEECVMIHRDSSESIFKYYEEKYDQIAFDDTNTTATVTEMNEELEAEPVNTGSPADQGTPPSDGMEDDDDHGPTDQNMIDDESEEIQAIERFDRTKISR